MDDYPVYQLSFDPGTHNLGVCISEINPDTGMMTPVEAHTVDILRIAETQFPDVVEIHGLLNAKLYAVEHVVMKLLTTWRPVSVCSEGPYFRRFPQPYKALVECVLSIRRAVIAYDPLLPLTVIQPNVVKESVGVKGTSNNKEHMRQALAGGQPLLDMSNIMLNNLDEHAIDAICVGKCNVGQRIVANENIANRCCA